MEVKGQPKVLFFSHFISYFWNRISFSLAWGLCIRLCWAALKDRYLPACHLLMQVTMAFWHEFWGLNLYSQTWKSVTLLTGQCPQPWKNIYWLCHCCLENKPYHTILCIEGLYLPSFLGGHSICEATDGHPKFMSTKNQSVCSLLLGVWAPILSECPLIDGFFCVHHVPCLGVELHRGMGSYIRKQIAVEMPDLCPFSFLALSGSFPEVFVKADVCFLFIREWGPSWSPILLHLEQLWDLKTLNFMSLNIFSRWYRGGRSLTSPGGGMWEALAFLWLVHNCFQTWYWDIWDNIVKGKVTPRASYFIPAGDGIT